MKTKEIDCWASLLTDGSGATVYYDYNNIPGFYIKERFIKAKLTIKTPEPEITVTPSTIRKAMIIQGFSQPEASDFISVLFGQDTW